MQGGIERAQIDEAFPGFELVIDEAVAQYEAEAPILSDVPQGPTREDLNDEIRGMRQELQGLAEARAPALAPRLTGLGSRSRPPAVSPRYTRRIGLT